LPNAHEGSSIACCARASVIWSKDGIVPRAFPAARPR
jgi:hypothetical protein